MLLSYQNPKEEASASKETDLISKIGNPISQAHFLGETKDISFIWWRNELCAQDGAEATEFGLCPAAQVDTT